jgi:peroxiredoxin
MKILHTILLLATFLQCACSNNDAKKSTTEDTSRKEAGNENPASNQIFTTDWKTLTKDFQTWYNYSYYNLNYSDDFIPLDVDSAQIEKEAFLQRLLTENVVAFKVKVQQGKSVYQLFNLNSTDESIVATKKQMAAMALANFKMEGKDIPSFNFTDLNGSVYNKANTKGKIIVLKCWFIHCVSCVKEFPELNKLVDKYNGRDDIVFISLAIDKRASLVKFLKTKEFKYATIPEMERYMVTSLNVTQYPTHLLIGKEGKIKKVTHKIEELIPFIKLETEANLQ